MKAIVVNPGSGEAVPEPSNDMHNEAVMNTAAANALAMKPALNSKPRDERAAMNERPIPATKATPT